MFHLEHLKNVSQWCSFVKENHKKILELFFRYKARLWVEEKILTLMDQINSGFKAFQDEEEVEAFFDGTSVPEWCGLCTGSIR